MLAPSVRTVSMGARGSLIFAPPAAGTQQAGGSMGRREAGKKGGEKRVLIPINFGPASG